MSNGDSLAEFDLKLATLRNYYRKNPNEVWYGMVWYGMVWYGMVWYGII